MRQLFRYQMVIWRQRCFFARFAQKGERCSDEERKRREKKQRAHAVCNMLFAYIRCKGLLCICAWSFSSPTWNCLRTRVSYFSRGRTQSRDQNATPRSARACSLVANAIFRRLAEFISSWLGCQLHAWKTITDTSVVVSLWGRTRFRRSRSLHAAENRPETDLHLYLCTIYIDVVHRREENFDGKKYPLRTMEWFYSICIMRDIRYIILGNNIIFK